MHPYPRFAGLPPEGEVLAALCIEMLMGEMVPRGVLSHRFCGGKVVPQAPKGGLSSPLCKFFLLS